MDSDQSTDNPQASEPPSQQAPRARSTGATSTGETRSAALAKTGSNIKETIESILVAFILAFVFRAFIVEAFVIPTGSMAPTLLGAHMRFRCPDCGYQFDVNTGTKSDGDDVSVPSSAVPPPGIHCPNCGWEIVGNAGRTETPAEEPVNYGDRILVLKYIYLLHNPRRWDVVVFKSPSEPVKNNYQQNFIKRLIGLPGEEIKILDGDIYVSRDQEKTWQIQRKPREVQEALWRIIYDNDYYPQHVKREGQADWVQPWKAAGDAKWDLGDGPQTGRVFQFDHDKGDGMLRFDFAANGSRTHSANDYLVYDVGAQAKYATVSDLKLATYYRRTAGSGALRLALSRHESLDHRFIAEITPERVRLIHQTGSGVDADDAESPLAEKEIGAVRLSDLGLAANGPMYVEMTDVDYQVTVRINGRDVLQTTDADYHPDYDWLMAHWDRTDGKPPGATIEAENQTCSLTHTSVWRDVYYTTTGDNRLKWGVPENPIRLGDHELFVLGDNSPISGDARFWTDAIDLPAEGLKVQAGRVPEQFLLGQAVFVYWPAGFRPFARDSMFSTFNAAAIPNFGDMRWIH